MARWLVPFISTASSSVEVEAATQEDAIERAYSEFHYPSAMSGDEFELNGEWEVEEELVETLD